jgi:nitrate reductase gamma subunit
MTVIESWFASLHTIEQSRLQSTAKRVASYIPGVFGYPLGGLTLVLALRVISSRMNESSTLTDSVTYLLVAIFAILFNYRLGRFLGFRIEESIHSFHRFGSILLTRGDDKQLDLANINNKLSLLKLTLSTLGGLLIGTISSLVASWLSK